MSTTLKLVTVWLLIGTAVFLGVRWFESDRQRARFEQVGDAIELRRQRDGHFHWPGRVNGVAVDFLVDTGATSSALPEALALQAGVAPDGEIVSSTANGTVRGRTGRADITLDGGVRVARLRVAVLPALGAPLLGMDVLSRLHFSQRGGVLRIEPAGR